MLNRLKWTLFLFGWGFFAGWLISQNSHVAKESVTFTSIARDPAAIRPVFDFSNLKGAELGAASSQRLISGAKVLHEKNEVGMELGHFVVRGQSGEKEFACQKYSQIVLMFESEGMAVSGERSKMEVEGACEISSDVNSIAALWIPTSKILGEPVADGEFDFREGKVIKVRFSNVSDEWPRQWQLKSVRLQNGLASEDTLFIDEKELREYAAQPIILDFETK